MNQLLITIKAVLDSAFFQNLKNLDLANLNPKESKKQFKRVHQGKCSSGI